MVKSLDKVLQSDGTWKWELVEPTASEKMGNGPEAPATTKPKATKKKPAKNKTTSPLTE